MRGRIEPVEAALLAVEKTWDTLTTEQKRALMTDVPALYFPLCQIVEHRRARREVDARLRGRRRSLPVSHGGKQ